jgi:thymidine phosphorylase
MLLGAGRATRRLGHRPGRGVILRKKLGDPVAAGEPLATILANDEGPAYHRAVALVAGAFTLGEGARRRAGPDRRAPLNLGAHPGRLSLAGTVPP